MKTSLTRRFWYLLAGAAMSISFSSVSAQGSSKFNSLGTLLTPDNCALLLTDASAGVSVEAHEMAIQRMIMGGVVPITFNVFQAELQRDWARTETVGQLVPILIEHMGNIGTNVSWEFQLLNAAPQKK